MYSVIPFHCQKCTEPSGIPSKSLACYSVSCNISVTSIKCPLWTLNVTVFVQCRSDLCGRRLSAALALHCLRDTARPERVQYQVTANYTAMGNSGYVLYSRPSTLLPLSLSLLRDEWSRWADRSSTG